MICFNGSDLISPKAINGLLQPRLQDDDDDDDDKFSALCMYVYHSSLITKFKHQSIESRL